jgi:hypothetical protein
MSLMFKKRILIGISVLVVFGLLGTPAVTDAARVSESTVYPERNDPGYGHIEWIRATSDGVVIRLTAQGLSKGKDMKGATELAKWTASLYSKLPLRQRKWYDLNWAVDPLDREINYHALAYNDCPSWMKLGCPQIRARANPVNARFADYWSSAGWILWWLD